jgi:DNA-binding PadR family transcriptional regulator
MDIYRKGELTFRILRYLHRHEAGVADLVDYLLTPGAGSKGSKTPTQLRKLARRREDRQWQTSVSVEKLRDKQRLYSLLHYLEKQGLIMRKAGDDDSFRFRLTQAGQEKQNAMVPTAWRSALPVRYEAESIESITVIIFDIPEQHRAKRAWLRDALRGMRFTMIQKSVWAARVKLPSTFIIDLKKIDLLRHVLIISTSAEGMIGGLA